MEGRRADPGLQRLLAGEGVDCVGPAGTAVLMNTGSAHAGTVRSTSRCRRTVPRARQFTALPVHRAAISLHPVAHPKGSSELIGGWCAQVHVYYGHDYCPPISTFTRVPERLLSSAGKSFEPGGYSASVAIPIARC